MAETEIILIKGEEIKSAQDLTLLAQSLARKKQSPALILCSAFGETSQRLAELTQSFFDGEKITENLLDTVRNFHLGMAAELFSGINNPVFDTLSNLLVEIEWILEDGPVDDYDYTFDQMAAVGPLISSTLLSAYLADFGHSNHWVDARNLIWTDNTYQNAQIDVDKSKAQIQTVLTPLLDQSWIITQTGIGTTSENFSTTLGQEGTMKTAQFMAEALGIHAYSAAPFTESA